MGCLTKAFVMAAGVAVAVGLTSKHHADRPPPRCAVERVRVSIASDGAVAFDGQHLASASAIAGRFADFARRHPPPRIDILSDRNTSYGKIAPVLQDASRAGLSCVDFLVTAPRANR